MVSQPDAPNPYATANAQNQQNAFAGQYSSAIGNVNEQNPYGSVNYSQTGEQVPIYNTSGQVTGYAPRTQRTTTSRLTSKNFSDRNVSQEKSR